MGYSGPNLSNLSNIVQHTYIVYKSGSTYYAFETSSGTVRYTSATFTTLMNTLFGAMTTGSIFVKNPGAAITIGATMTCQNKNIHVYGDNTYLNYSGYNNIIFHFEDTSTYGVYDCGVHNFQCMGTYTNANEVFAKFTNVKATVEGCFTNASDGCNRLVYLYGDCSRSRIQNNKNRFYNPIKIEGYTSGSLRESNYSSITDNNFDMFYDASNLNTFLDCDYGKYIKVANNSVIGNTYGIDSDTAHYMTITGNNFHGGVTCLDITSDMCTITGNVIIDGYLNYCGIKFTSTFGTTITGNIIYSASNNNFKGIDCQTSRRFTIEGNVIIQESTPTGTYGIYASGTCQDPIIVGNVITATSAITGTGIYLGAITRGVVAHNQIYQYSTPINIATVNSGHVRWNEGYQNHNQGATSVADGGTISHGLTTTPTGVICTPIISGEFVSVTAKAASTFTVAIKTHAGAAGTTQIIQWYAWV